MKVLLLDDAGAQRVGVGAASWKRTIVATEGSLTLRRGVDGFATQKPSASRSASREQRNGAVSFAYPKLDRIDA